MTVQELIEKYELENKNILKRRPDLDINGDFTTDGIKIFCNCKFIQELKELNQHDSVKSKVDICEHNNTNLQNIRCSFCTDCGQIIETDI